MKTLACLAILICTMISPAYSANRLLLSGYIETSTTSPSTPLNGTYAYRVIYYKNIYPPTSFPDETVGTPTIGSVTIEKGYFTISYDMPSFIIDLSRTYAQLAIDTDKNGLTDKDNFNRRIQLLSLITAPSVAPAAFFVAHNGSIGVGQEIHEVPSTLCVAPFTPPSEGFQFNKMSIWRPPLRGGATSGKISFAIYNDKGEKIADSGIVQLTPTQARREIIEVNVPITRLVPSSLYFTAYATDGNITAIHNGTIPPIKGVGVVRNVVANMNLPAKFDPTTIVMSLTLEPVLPVGLSLVP